MGKNKHSKDKLYLNPKELAEHWGGFKKKEDIPFLQLPYECCALSLQPWENPVCTREGHVFDIKNIIPYVKARGINPCTGKPLKASQLIPLSFYKNDEGKYHCPVTMKEFSNAIHIVTNAKSGNVYEYVAIDNLCRKNKNWKDPMSGEPFSNSDVVHLNNPNDTKNRVVAEYHHIVEKHDFMLQKEKPGVRPTEAMARIFEEKKQKEDAAAAAKAEAEANMTEEEKKARAEAAKPPPPAAKKHKHERFTSGAVSSSFTSTSMALATDNALRENTDLEERQLTYEKVRKAKRKGYARLVTNMGDLNVELHCDIAPIACDNFIRHCKSGYYNGTKFHRLIKNFIMQGGDPKGTGKGGESAFEGGEPFKCELDTRLKHIGPGILSMANAGKNTNRSQFFITFRDAQHLDLKHTIFGRVVGGLKLLDTLNQFETDGNDKPRRKITIDHGIIFKNPFEEILKEEYEPPKKKDDGDAMWFSNRTDPMENHDRRNESTVGKYLSLSLPKKKEEKPTEEELAGAVPSRRKVLRTNMDFSAW